MSFRLLPVVVAVLALVIWAQAQEPAPESTVTSLLPEPAADKVASGMKTLKSLYASDYRRTQDSNKLQAQFAGLGLARKLLKTAAETPPDSDGYYPMLSEAARLATIGNKPDVAFDAIGRLSAGKQRGHVRQTATRELRAASKKTENHGENVVWDGKT